ncbi:thioredoxin family protein [Roseivirga echinicomitans]
MAVELVNDTNFENEIRENENVVVKYFAGWCGSCRLFSPKFRRLSADDRFAGVKFLDVDAEESPNARNLGKVSNLPTFAIFKNGELVETIASNKEDQVVELILKLK